MGHGASTTKWIETPGKLDSYILVHNFGHKLIFSSAVDSPAALYVRIAIHTLQPRLKCLSRSARPSAEQTITFLATASLKSYYPLLVFNELAFS